MITTRGRYALRVMIDLVEHENGSYIPLKDIAARQGLSKKYLEIIVKEMVGGGLIVGTSGKGGGYKLCRKPEEYTIYEILSLMEGSLASVSCLADPSEPCPRESVCETLPMWTEFDNLVQDYFTSRTLKDICPSPN